MGRRFITSRDIDDLLGRGESELVLSAEDVLTDLAREQARDRGVTVTRHDDGRAAAPSAPTEGPADVVQGAVAGEGPSRRRLRAAVRAAVVEELGGSPAGLDAAIGRVLDRHGVQD